MVDANNKEVVQEVLPSSFPVPFTLEAFRQDITEVFFYQMRTLAQMTDPKTALRILNIEIEDDRYENDIYDQDNSATDVGVTYDHIRNTTFAVALERLYEYAFYGKWDINAESMGDEGIYMWASGIVCDALRSDVAGIWGAFGWNIESHAKRCVLVAETANARNILEGGENFHHFNDGIKRELDDTDDECEGVLTIKQMALLSGMEEMSIRAAANPKRANQLVTVTEYGGTRVKCDVAKVWLESKGRYVNITFFKGQGDLDLAKRKFTSYYDIWLVLTERCKSISERDGDEVTSLKLKSLGVLVMFDLKKTQSKCFREKLINEKMMHDLAEVLELPTELFVLRAKELVANQMLVEVENQLRNASNLSH